MNETQIYSTIMFFAGVALTQNSVHNSLTADTMSVVERRKEGKREKRRREREGRRVKSNRML